MSKKANPTLIGIFIVTGVLLCVAGVFLFTTTRIFSRSWDNIVYFSGSLNGLREGAPVKYRGVTIGSVKRVMIHFNQHTNDYVMPVILELEEDLLRGRWEEHIGSFSSTENLNSAIRQGLRASLKAESFVTGVLYVELDIDPNAPPPVFHQLKPIYPEIPTRSTDIQQLMENLASVDFKGIESKLSQLITNVDTALASLKLGDLSAGITNVLVSFNRFASSPELTNTLVSVQKTMTEYQKLGAKLNDRVNPLADGATNALTQVNQTLGQLREAVQDLNSTLAPDAPLHRDLLLALEQISGAANSISALADFLERYPNALITGRKQPEKKP